MDAKKDLVGSIFNQFNPQAPIEETVDKKPVTFWLPVDYTAKYGQLQGQTKCRFGKEIQKMIMSAIDISLDEKAS